MAYRSSLYPTPIPLLLLSLNVHPTVLVDSLRRNAMAYMPSRNLIHGHRNSSWEEQTGNVFSEPRLLVWLVNSSFDSFNILTDYVLYSKKNICLVRERAPLIPSLNIPNEWGTRVPSMSTQLVVSKHMSENLSALYPTNAATLDTVNLSNPKGDGKSYSNK